MTKQLKLQLTPTLPLTPAEFWNKKFKPMLAYNKEFDLKDVRLPCYVSEKIDGIRCIIHEGGIPRTRDNKMIPNRYIRKVITEAKLPAGFDGELITMDALYKTNTFHKIQSEVMSEDGEPYFEFQVFDYASHFYYKMDYSKRVALLEEDVLDNSEHDEWLKFVEQQYCPTLTELDLYVRLHSDTEYREGAIIRSAKGPYKFGRSTFSEQYLLKVTPWRRTEATIVGFEEELINDDTSCAKKENLRPANSLGALVCKWEGCAETFNIGSGFTREERAEIWDRRDFYLKKQVTFKYKPYGTKDKPRTPIFVGVRLEGSV